MPSFIFDFLPSFYRDNMVDANGDNILSPLFNQYANAMGDAISQAQQIATIPYLETCPLFIKEYFKTVDIRASNSCGTNCYYIDGDIIAIDSLYYDSAFTIAAPTFSIKHNIATNRRYIEFNTTPNIRASTLYAPVCTKDKNILLNVFGSQLNYKPLLPSNYHDAALYNYTTNYDAYSAELETYRGQLIALTQALAHGPTYLNVQNTLGMFIGLKYCPFDAIVRSNDGSTIILEEVLTEQLTTITGNINTNFTVGTEIAKYTILENLTFMLYDMYSDPSRFTQCLLYDYSAELLNQLSIDTANNERYATLHYDTTINLDDDNIYWDMGNNTGISHTPPGGTTDYPHQTVSLLNRFDDYVDTRFQSQKIYEMFRNLFIIEVPNNTSDATIANITYFLDRIKAKYTKYIINITPNLV